MEEEETREAVDEDSEKSAEKQSRFKEKGRCCLEVSTRAEPPFPNRDDG